MTPDKYATVLAIIKAEYAEHGHKTKRSVHVAVENRIKRKARNMAIVEGLRIYALKERGYVSFTKRGNIQFIRK